MGRRFLAEYVSSTAGLAPRSRENIVCVVWPALAYAIRDGAPCQALPERPRFPRVQSRRPYIFTDDEINRMLRVALALGPDRPDGALRPHTYSTLFALLVTTGLRICEALRLNLSDIDLDGSILDVQEGKFKKARRIPLRESTAAGLARYQSRRREAGHPFAPESPLFVSGKRRRLSHPAVITTFRACLRRAAIQDLAGRLPRVHDLRHSFAVRRVLAWYREGIDVHQRLPALATYLGHVDISYTLRYLQPNDSTLREAARRFEAHSPIPTVGFPQGVRR